MTGIVFDIKELAVHDGPGLRTTVFLKGCPLRCAWCHNPEGFSAAPELMVRSGRCTQCGACRQVCSHPDCQPFGRCLHICPHNLVRAVGKTYTPEALAERLLKNRAFFGADGGVTFSGGEPLLQADFLLETMDLMPDVPCVLETSGYASVDTFARVAERMSLIYLDIKLADESAHTRWTGVRNAPILQNLEYVKTHSLPCVIRTPLIPGITDTEENLSAIAALISDLPWEQLPYNALAGAKYAQLSKKYPLEAIK